jgi:molybdopterin synthase catalytic subunit
VTLAAIETRVIDEAAVARRVASTAAGALVTFAGTVRDNHLGRVVTAIEYHAYESMALKELGRIEGEARERWPDVRIEIVHRVGRLEVGETSVFIGVSSPHRAEGFAALRFAIERVKESAPIWKKEMYPDGHAWIEGS